MLRIETQIDTFRFSPQERFHLEIFSFLFLLHRSIKLLNPGSRAVFPRYGQESN